MATNSEKSRRQFLITGTTIGTGLVFAGLSKADDASGMRGPEEITPPEDLMREHGVLNRILLIYEEGLRRYRRRWKIERVFAWLHNFRRLVVRYEYHATNFLGMLQLRCIAILLRHF